MPPQRGRKSAADLAVVPGAGRARRPAPPGELSKAEAAEWRDVVSALPEDWFSKEHFGVLIAYVRHTCRNRFIAKAINEFEAQGLKSNTDLDAYNKLCAAAERETRALLAAARALRLTHQARQEPKSAYRRTQNYNPSFYETQASFYASDD